MITDQPGYLSPPISRAIGLVNGSEQPLLQGGRLGMVKLRVPIPAAG